MPELHASPLLEHLILQTCKFFVIRPIVLHNLNVLIKYMQKLFMIAFKYEWHLNIVFSSVFWCSEEELLQMKALF